MVFVVKLPIFSMPACVADNRNTVITCCSNFVSLNNCLSLNLQSMLVCTFCYVVAKKNQLEKQRNSSKINAAREESSRHPVPGCRSKAKSESFGRNGTGFFFLE